MVLEYFGIPCTNLDSQSSESLGTSDTNIHMNSDIVVNVVESFSAGILDSIHVPKNDTPPSSISTTGSPSASISASSESFCDTLGASKSPKQDLVSPLKEEGADVGEAETDSSVREPSNPFSQFVLSVNIEQEKTVVQQEIVDMYMKSMQQFTESLTKMKLPMDTKNGHTTSGNLSSDKELEALKGTGSRVFCRSRAFFRTSV
ncbi:hypothetical protein HHK36_005766 [Tetracentron sinense]|uniref:Uncharacterized protein n=1 Tax=Tetracentron sinense TaxID=13715 RepID=A0A834ZVZ0_TETSI|nr:hypothetical protein HHK36_005766 [Tetracentron sinense]